VSELKDETSLTTSQKQQIVVNNLQQAILAASTVLDQKYPSDTLWITMLTKSLNDLLPHIISLCISMSNSVLTSSFFATHCPIFSCCKK